MSAAHLTLLENRVCFALQAVELYREHGFDDIDVSIYRHEFTECLNVVGRMGPDGDFECFVPIAIPADWSPELRDSLEESFYLAARVGIAIARGLTGGM